LKQVCPGRLAGFIAGFVVLSSVFAPLVRAAGDSSPIIPRLTGIAIVADPKDVVSTGTPNATGVQIKGLSLLENGGMREKLAAYLGKPLTESDRVKIVSEIVLFYRSRGRNTVDVRTPPQEITGGVLQVLVIEGKAGTVRVDGARWFDSKYIGKQMRVAPGQELDSTQLAADLDWINRNPFRQVDLVYAKGSELGQSDLVLKETDHFPLRVYTGYDDSGTTLTGNYRLTAGFNWGNVFGLDGQLNYQYMTDPQTLFFKAHSLTYIQPLSWRHTLMLVGSYATTHGDVPSPFDLGGFNWQTSAHYEMPLPSWGTYREALDAGFDYKRANNNLAFGGQTVYGGTVDTIQWSLSYNSSLSDSWGGTTLRATIFYSPGGITDQNTNAAYALSRSGAAANYTYGKVELNRTTGLPFDFSFVNLFTFQASDANLLGSEQLGLGGYDTIRGYDTRVVNADQGLIISSELRTPPLSPFSLFHWKDHPADKLQFIGFVDYGLAGNKHLLPGEDASTELLGVGPGLRYALASNLTVRADYGWQLMNAPAGRINSERWHVGVVLSY
jgi:hemolysin activation/secretion protein